MHAYVQASPYRRPPAAAEALPAAAHKEEPTPSRAMRSTGEGGHKGTAIAALDEKKKEMRPCPQDASPASYAKPTTGRGKEEANGPTACGRVVPDGAVVKQSLFSQGSDSSMEICGEAEATSLLSMSRGVGSPEPLAPGIPMKSLTLLLQNCFPMAALPLTPPQWWAMDPFNLHRAMMAAVRGFLLPQYNPHLLLLLPPSLGDGAAADVPSPVALVEGGDQVEVEEEHQEVSHKAPQPHQGGGCCCHYYYYHYCRSVCLPVLSASQHQTLSIPFSCLQVHPVVGQVPLPTPRPPAGHVLRHGLPPPRQHPRHPCLGPRPLDP